MCTLAGYVGASRAAPILLEMAKRQEGLWSGFYSGLATAHDGRIHHDKIVGDMAKLTRETPAADFPGNAGLIHSRTRSGGDREWAHPFLDDSGTLACVAQGSHGFFKDHTPRVELAEELLAQGRRFLSAVPGQIGSYPALSNGASVHSTEIIAFAVAAAFDRLKDPLRAVAEVTRRVPDEAVYVFMFHDDPASLYVSVVNQRLVIGLDDSGAFLASSALAFPESVRWVAEAPGNTLAVVSPHGVRFAPLFPPGVLAVAEVFPAGIEQACVEFIQSNPGSRLSEVVDGPIGDLFPKEGLVRKAVAGYRTIERLLASGRTQAETRAVPGVIEGETAPLTVFFA